MSLNVLLRSFDIIRCVATILLKRYISDSSSETLLTDAFLCREKRHGQKFAFSKGDGLPLSLSLSFSFPLFHVAGFQDILEAATTWPLNPVRSRSYRSRVDQELEGPSSSLHQPRLLLLPLLSSHPYHEDHVVVLSELRSETFMSRSSRQNNRSHSSDYVAAFVDLCPGHRSKVDLFSRPFPSRDNS